MSIDTHCIQQLTPSKLVSQRFSFLCFLYWLSQIRKNLLQVFWGTGLFHEAQWFPAGVILLQTLRFHSFYDWVVFHSVYIPHFLHPVISKWASGLIPQLSYYALCCYKHELRVTLAYAGSISFDCISRSGMAGSYGRLTFRHQSNFHIVFPSGCTSLHSYILSNIAFIFLYDGHFHEG